MNSSSMQFFCFLFFFFLYFILFFLSFTYSCVSWRPIAVFFMELKFHTNFFFFFFFFLRLIAPYLIFYKSSFTLKLDFEKIELQKRDISLISLGKGVEGCIICAKMALAQIPPQFSSNRVFH